MRVTYRLKESWDYTAPGEGGGATNIIAQELGAGLPCVGKKQYIFLIYMG